MTKRERLLTWDSGRQRCIGLLIMAVTGDECLRRHPCVEVRIRERRSIWHFLQVSGTAISVFKQPLTTFQIRTVWQ